MDARMILMGRGIDPVGAFDRADVASGNALAVRQQRDTQNLFRTQGPQIMAGDPTALNALATIAPDAALSIQGQRLDMDATRARITALDNEDKRRIAETAARLSAEEAAKVAADTEEDLRILGSVTDPEMWDRVAEARGVPDLVGMFDQRDIALAKSAEAFKVFQEASKPAAPADEYGRYLQEEAAAGRQPLSRIDYAKAKSPSSIIRSTPDGGMEVLQGAAAVNPKLTEAQSKDNVFLTRATGALAKLEEPIDANAPDAGVLADSLAGFQDASLNKVPLVGNYMTSDNFQVARTAADEFLQAILRKDTGAAITAPEQELYGNTYLPQPGDSPARLAFKREARKRAVKAIETGMTEAQLEAVARVDQAILEQLPKEQGGAAQPSAGPKVLRFDANGDPVQ